MSVPILCYHKVGSIEVEGRFINIEPALLEAHVKFLARRYGRFLRAMDLAVRPWPKRAACLTFDDGYVSTMTAGIEVLRRLQATATIFAVSNKVGQLSDWDQNSRPLADWDALSAAQSQGFEIGNHTADHVRLGELGVEAQVRQIRQCEQSLLDHGIKPGSFCYPFGSFNAESAGALRQCGYSVGVTVVKRIATERDDLLQLPRISLSNSDRLAMLLYKLYVRPRLP